MKRYIKQYIVILYLSLLLGCAAGPDAAGNAARSDFARGSDCISEGSVRDYKVLNDSNLVVTAQGRRKYHIELTRRAPGLRSAWSIGFTSPTSRICAGFSEVLVDDSFGPEKVRIQSIRGLTAEEYEDLLYRFGKAAAGKQEPPAPEPVDGAEVEELD